MYSASTLMSALPKCRATEHALMRFLGRSDQVAFNFIFWAN